MSDPKKQDPAAIVPSTPAAIVPKEEKKGQTVAQFLSPPKVKVECAPEHKGTKRYQIPAGERFYSNTEGRFYEPGEVITVTDFKPGKNWLREA